MTIEAVLEERCRSAGSIEALAFTIANETWQLARYRQGLVWRDRKPAPQLLAVSGLTALTEDSPFTVWLRNVAKALRGGLGESVRLIDLSAEAGNDDAATGVASALQGWQEWWPPYLVLVPLVRQSEVSGMALFVFDERPGDPVLAALGRLQSTWSYCAWALSRRATIIPVARLPWRRLGIGLLALALVLLGVPVHQTVLAPAEIVALEAMAIAAPLDGIIKTFHVQPNQAVKAGQPLFSLDETTLRNKRDIAARGLDVALSELLSAQQKAFDDLNARSEVATLQGRIAERRAELRAVDEQFKRVTVTAPRDGIAVFGDINDWQGRPVATGERIMQLADPRDAGILVYLAASDAIALGVGERLRVFLNTKPLSPIEATLIETSYLAVLSPEGVASYRLRGRIDAAEEGTVRIGLKGTAKIYGEKVSLAYYLFRRPLAAMRRWSGL